MTCSLDLRGLLGEHTTLGHPSRTERAIVGAAIFEHPRSVVGEVIRRIDAADPRAETSERRLAVIARPDGDPLERAAAFAVAFDPLRIAALKLFSALGAPLVPRAGAATIKELNLDAAELDAAAVRGSAAALTNVPPPHGLKPLAALRARLRRRIDSGGPCDRSSRTTGASNAAGSWRRARTATASVGTPFDPPTDQFNGYTLARDYASSSSEPYLDAGAWALLTDARATFGRLALADTPIMSWGQDVVLFPWIGDRVLDTLALMLRRQGLGEAARDGVALLIPRVDAAEVGRALDDILGAPPSALDLVGEVRNKIVEKHHPSRSLWPRWLGAARAP